MCVGILQANLEERLADAFFSHDFSHAASQTADDGSVLDGDYTIFRILAGFCDLGIRERLECRDVEMIDLHAFCRQGCRGAERFFRADGGREDRHICVFFRMNDAGFVELHRFVRREETRHFLAQLTDIDRSVVLVGNVQDAVDLRGVADVKDREIRDCADDAYVIGGLMGYAARCRNARHKSAEDHREIRVGNAHFQLVQDAAVQEYGKCVDKWAEALAREAGCPGAHVLLGDSQCQVTVRIFFAKFRYLAGGAQIAGKDQDFGMLLSHAEDVRVMSVQLQLHD